MLSISIQFDPFDVVSREFDHIFESNRSRVLNRGRGEGALNRNHFNGCEFVRGIIRLKREAILLGVHIGGDAGFGLESPDVAALPFGS